MKKIYEINEQNILNVWDENTILLHYTGYMYGIGCSAFSKESCRKINKFKKRDGAKGFIILMPSISWLARYELTLHEKNKRLPAQYWPGNITMILEDTKNYFSHLSIDGKVAVRIPSDPNLRKFISIINEPIVSTSVNESGEQPLQNLEEIDQKKWFDLAFIPKNTQFKIPEPSTIIDVTSKEIKCIREGMYAMEDIRRSADKSHILFVCTANICRSPMAEYIAAKMVMDNNMNFRIS